ncbi:DUF551 domain-containing protein [Microvirga zambiensis]|uniref:DUF551 domain-containing protein n=1 Tax=Microvirga zambiensis TaxID=1402137 RepID=UPI00191D0525
MNWQLIETAPKDGTRVLVYLPDGKQAVAWWELEFEPILWDQSREDSKYRSAWTDGTMASWACEEMRELNPTHWMPLPEPPASLRSPGQGGE